MARIAGVKSLHIAELTGAGDATNVGTYGTLTELKQFISFSGTVNRAESSWYSNNKVEENFSQITGAELEAVVGKLQPSVKAGLSGASYTNGVITRKSTDRQKEYGVLVIYELMGSNGGQYSEFYYRTKLAVDSIEGETKTDSITDSPVTISGMASPVASGQVMSTLAETGGSLKSAAELFAEYKLKTASL